MKKFTPLLLALLIVLLLFPAASLAEETHADHCVCGTTSTVNGHTHSETFPTWEGITSFENLSGGGTTTLNKI